MILNYLQVCCYIYHSFCHKYLRCLEEEELLIYWGVLFDISFSEIG